MESPTLKTWTITSSKDVGCSDVRSGRLLGELSMLLREILLGVSAAAITLLTFADNRRRDPYFNSDSSGNWWVGEVRRALFFVFVVLLARFSVCL